MNFVNHSKLSGLHAPFSPSQPAWLRYSDEKAIAVQQNKKAAELGTSLHAWAKETIDMGIKQPRSKKTLYAYVNDAIGFRMSTEVVLYYSDRFFGTADAICFRNNKLRIHDLKTGIGPVHMEQLEVYAALFCLEYKIRPGDIEFELCNPSAAQNTIDGIMDKVDGIASFPESGAKLVFENGLDSGYRYVVFKNYLAFYRLRPNNVVYVDRVIYGGRDYMRILFPGL